MKRSTSLIAFAVSFAFANTGLAQAAGDGTTAAPAKGSSGPITHLSTKETAAFFGGRFGMDADPVEPDEFVSFLEEHGLDLPHPLCVGGAAPRLASAEDDCPGLDEDEALEISLRDGIPYLYADHPTQDEWGSRPAFTSYKLIGIYNGRLFLRTTWSGGGSGTWLNAVSFNQDDDESVAMDGGDRCNGSVSAFKLSEGEVLEIETSLTPYDLLNYYRGDHHASRTRSNYTAKVLDLRGEEESGDFAGWHAYDDVSACAICCGGSVRSRFELERLDEEGAISEAVRFNSRFYEKAMNRSDPVPGDRAIARVLLGEPTSADTHPLADKYLSPEQYSKLLDWIRRQANP